MTLDCAPMTQRSLVAATALVALAWPTAAAARDVKAQNNEVAFDVDATFARRGQNNSDVALTYTWLPGALDQNDEVVPALRTFVRQPHQVWVGLRRTGDSYDSVTGLHGGGTGWLGERFYGSAELGIEYDSVQNEIGQRIENAFISGNGRVEAGARVLPLLQLGGFYRIRPVLVPLPETNLVGDTIERSGAQQDFGAAIGLATPDDRLLLMAQLGYRVVDWRFTGSRNPGELGATGLVGALQTSYQLSSTTSLTLRGEVSSLDWENRRMGQEDINELGGQATVLSVRGDLGFLYWFEGHWGFRVSFGGGYVGEGPVEGSFESGLFRLGIGFTTRY